MPRRPHRLIAALLWLAILLLPLRGVAAVWMHGGAPALPPTAVAAEGDTHAVAMPCHGEGVAHDATSGSDASPAGAPHGCQLCDLCHGGVAVAPEAPAMTPFAAALAPLTRGATPPARHAPDGLYRPPR
jgi:hypothetical protein